MTQDDVVKVFDDLLLLTNEDIIFVGDEFVGYKFVNMPNVYVTSYLRNKINSYNLQLRNIYELYYLGEYDSIIDSVLHNHAILTYEEYTLLGGDWKEWEI